MPARQDDHLAVGAEEYQCGYRAWDRLWGSLSQHGQDQQDASYLHAFDSCQESEEFAMGQLGLSHSMARISRTPALCTHLTPARRV